MGQMIRRVFNLEFPSYCSQLDLFGYRFSRVEDYANKLRQLQHFVSVFSEFDIQPSTGTHAITAFVQVPTQAPRPVLEWATPSATALDDIMLLLSLATGRHVFALTDDALNQPITADPRKYPWGGVVGASIPYEAAGATAAQLKYDVGFERGINAIYSLVRDHAWRSQYGKGYFLLLARQAFGQHILEAAFIQCWTIWEHLFAVLNRQWISGRQIQHISAEEKIAFLLVRHQLKDEIDNRARAQIAHLVGVRNRLVHYGRLPDKGNVHRDAVLFIRLTEAVVAKAIGLVPSNVFNTVEQLGRFLMS